VPHLRHDGGLPLEYVGRRRLAAELQRIGQRGGNEGADGTRQSCCATAEMLLGTVPSSGFTVCG
jgi:hypothetical protein